MDKFESVEAIKKIDPVEFKVLNEFSKNFNMSSHPSGPPLIVWSMIESEGRYGGLKTIVSKKEFLKHEAESQQTNSIFGLYGFFNLKSFRTLKSISQPI